MPLHHLGRLGYNRFPTRKIKQLMAYIYHIRKYLENQKMSTYSSNGGIIFENTSYCTDPFGANVISALQIYTLGIIFKD